MLCALPNGTVKQLIQMIRYTPGLENSWNLVQSAHKQAACSQ